MFNLFVLAVSASLLSFSCGHLYCTHELGFEYRGNVTEVLAKPSNNDCQEACKNAPVCQGYSYDTRMKTCHLKSVTSDRVERRGMISGRCTSCTMEENIDYPGNDIHRHFVDSLFSCTEACFRTEYCVAYTYDRVSGSCWVKHREGRHVDYEPMKHGNVIVSGSCVQPNNV